MELYQHPRYKLAELKPFRYHFIRPADAKAKPSGSPSSNKSKPKGWYPNPYNTDPKWIELAGILGRTLRPFPEALRAFQAAVDAFHLRYPPHPFPQQEGGYAWP